MVQHELQTERMRYEALIRGEQFTKPKTIEELATVWLDHCRTTYPTRHGKRSNTFTNGRDATRPLLHLYAKVPITSFGTVQIQALRLYMIDLGLSRRTINDRVSRIRQMYQWAKERGWLNTKAVEALKVEGLRRGRSAATDPPAKHAVPIELVLRTIRDRQLQRVIKDMIRFQLRTGARPGEVCELRGDQIETSGSEWVWRPPHKMDWVGRTREILIGPRAQLVLLPYLVDGFCFTTQRDQPYRIDSYRQAIVRACGRLDLPRWTPHQIRKRAADEAVDHGNEITARDLLGHQDVRTTLRHYVTPRPSKELRAFVRDHG